MHLSSFYIIAEISIDTRIQIPDQTRATPNA